MENHDIDCEICKKPMVKQRQGKTVMDITCIKHGIKTGEKNHCRECCPNKDSTAEIPCSQCGTILNYPLGKGVDSAKCPKCGFKRIGIDSGEIESL